MFKVIEKKKRQVENHLLPASYVLDNEGQHTKHLDPCKDCLETLVTHPLPACGI